MSKKVILFFVCFLMNLSLKASVGVALEQVSLDSPTYLILNKLSLEIGNYIIKNEKFGASQIEISYSFNGSSVTRERVDSFNLDKKIECIKAGMCVVSNLLLNPTYKERTCEISVKIFANEDVLFLKNLKWGNCRPINQGAVKENDLTNLELEILEVANENVPDLGLSYFINSSNITGDNSDIIALGLDNHNNPIWSARDITSQGEAIFDFKITPNQELNLCKLRIIIDPYGKTNDTNLENNYLDVNFGKCFSNNSSESLPDLKMTSNSEKLIIFNDTISHVNAEFIGLSFRVYNEQGGLDKEFVRSVAGGLDYKDYRTMDLEDILGRDNCHFVVSVNYDHRILEKDFNNNFLEINTCNVEGEPNEF